MAVDLGVAADRPPVPASAPSRSDEGVIAVSGEEGAGNRASATRRTEPHRRGVGLVWNGVSCLGDIRRSKTNTVVLRGSPRLVQAKVARSGGMVIEKRTSPPGRRQRQCGRRSRCRPAP